jgi:hypothetical protein
MAISTVSKFSAPNTDWTKGIIKRIFGRSIPDGVLHVDLEDDINNGDKLVNWITATGKHSMTLDTENMEDSLTSVLVTMRMTC